jgi:hypothetical protein
MVLFFPSLVAMTTLIHKMVHDDYYNPFTGLYSPKSSGSGLLCGGSRCLGMGVLLFFGLLAYGYYAYDTNFGWIGPSGSRWPLGFRLFLLPSRSCLHLLVYNDYISDDTFP